jgi:Ca-activated chloride channel family protein
MNVRPIEARAPMAGCPCRPPGVYLLVGLVLLFALIPTVSWGSLSGKVRRGNKEYGRANFDQALQHYRDAQLEDPESPPLHFNVGNALHKQQNWKEALEEYGMTLSTQDSALAQAVHYNMGNTLYRQGNLPEAIEAYKKSLRNNPGDMDAKYNLELAQMKLQESPQQQQQPQEQQGEESQEERQDQQQEQQQEQGETQKQQDRKQQEQPGEEEQQQQQQAQEQQEEQKPPPRPAEPGQMSPEEAAQLLNALEELEKKAQEERLRARSPEGPRSEWDW